MPIYTTEHFWYGSGKVVLLPIRTVRVVYLHLYRQKCDFGTSESATIFGALTSLYKYYGR